MALSLSVIVTSCPVSALFSAMILLMHGFKKLSRTIGVSSDFEKFSQATMFERPGCVIPGRGAGGDAFGGGASSEHRRCASFGHMARPSPRPRSTKLHASGISLPEYLVSLRLSKSGVRSHGAPKPRFSEPLPSYFDSVCARLESRASGAKRGVPVRDVSALLFMSIVTYACSPRTKALLPPQNQQEAPAPADSGARSEGPDSIGASGTPGNTGVTDDTSAPPPTSETGATGPTSGTGAPSALDRFGIRELYPSRSPALSWSAIHWLDAGARTLSGADPADPSGWSSARGNGQVSFDSAGTMELSGSQPRLYITPSTTPFRDVEVTIYARRGDDEATPWAGIVVGVRSGPNGHGTSGGDNCTATTYYGRLRNDGRVDVEKELEHPASAVRESHAVWDGAPLPKGQWIGMKVVVYNTEQGVKLEVYRDMQEGVSGGAWEKLAETHDTGQWAPTHNCPYAEDFVIAQGGGTVLVRNTNVITSSYKWMSIREISPSL
jgi:hypothetical protein